MEQMSGDRLQSQETRRWPRYQVELPVRIIALNGVLTTPVTGRGSAISRAGMALQAGIALNPGDLMQLQFPTTDPSRVNAVVRNRNGSCLGLEFLSQLPLDAEAAAGRSEAGSSSAFLGPLKSLKIPGESCSPQSLHAALSRKREELMQLRKEIEVLSVAILLLAENEEDERNICKLPARERIELDIRPWPPHS